MQRPSCRVFAVVAAFGPYGAAGCGREPAAAPPAQAPRREPTKLFAQLAERPAPDALKTHFESKFPDLDFHTASTGAMPLRTQAGGPGRVHLELQLVLSRKGDESRDTEAAWSLVLGELEAYLKARAGAAGAEVVGPVTDTASGGKRAGFRFEYRTPAAAGYVLVEPQAKVAGGLVVVVEESE